MKAEEEQKLDALWSVWETWLLYVKTLILTYLHTHDYGLRVNRGSLFPLNDETFHFFIQIEEVVRVLLPKHIVKTDSDIGVQKVIKQVLEDEDVQFNWTLISQDLDSYEEAQELLYEVVRLWVTIRGFSIASMWMETYKQATKQTKQKSTGLRKHLS